MAGIPVVRTEHLPYLLTDPDQKSRHRLAASLVRRARCRVGSRRRELSSAGLCRHRHDPQRHRSTSVARRARGETRARLAIADDARLVITVARFTAQKGYDILLHAAVEVSRQMPDAVFLLVGDGLEREAMVELAASLELANVSFLGERADVPDLLAAADLFVLPSLFEGLAPCRAGGDGAGSSGRCNPHRRHR